MTSPQKEIPTWASMTKGAPYTGSRRISRFLVAIQPKSRFLDSQRKSTIELSSNCSGAKSVAAQMFAFNGRDDGLFRGAILESGAPVTGIYWPATSDYSQRHYELLVSKAGCSSAESKLECLRSLDYSVLWESMKPSKDFVCPFYSPSIDGNFIAESPSRQLESGNFVKIPTIQGQTTDEGSLFTVMAMSNSDEETRAWFASISSYPAF